MTLHKPTIYIARIVVQKGGKAVFDEELHHGLNVLFGRNGGGKTSVVQLLVHGLGYEISKWKDEAGSCDFVILEVHLNGAPITFRRAIGSAKQSVSVCYKPYSAAKASGIEEWFSYPYAVGSKDSFSQKIFSLLGMPEPKSDSAVINFHQILRVIYNDQSNPASFIFNIEPFDSAFKREAIGNYLLGLHDDELYSMKIDLAASEKRLDSVISELKAIYSVVGLSGLVGSFSSVDFIIKEHEEKLLDLRHRIEGIRNNQLIDYRKEKSAVSSLSSESIDLKIRLSELESKISMCGYEIKDSSEFIEELSSKLRSINDAVHISEYAPRIIFNMCPSCFSDIRDAVPGCCALCGSAVDDEQRKTSMLRMKNELQLQINESTRLLERKRIDLDEVEADKRVVLRSLRGKISQFSSSVKAIGTADEKVLFDIYKEIGETEEKLDNISKISGLYEAIQRLVVARDSLQAKVNQLRDEITAKEHMYSRREPEVRRIISEYVCWILRKDTGLEKEFANADVVEFDFSSNHISVNGKSYFSESSMFLLNNALHVALLKLSTIDSGLRLPRFMILDGIENGGMEEPRSKNFQRVIRDLMADSPVDYQLIIATKNADEELRVDDYMVGKYFSADQKSLQF